MLSFLDSLENWFDHSAHVDVNLHHVAQAVVTVLAVINPVVCGSIFLALTPKLSVAQRHWAAVRAALSILIILTTSALVGLKVLRRRCHVAESSA